MRVSIDTCILLDLTKKIIGIAMAIHRALGPGFLEGVYGEAFIYELERPGFPYRIQKEFTIKYKNIIQGFSLCRPCLCGEII